jgi:hypothetical protein
MSLSHIFLTTFFSFLCHLSLLIGVPGLVPTLGPIWQHTPHPWAHPNGYIFTFNQDASHVQVSVLSVQQHLCSKVVKCSEYPGESTLSAASSPACNLFSTKPVGTTCSST